MATLVLRTTKGSELTWQEADDNFTNLNNDILALDNGTVAAGVATNITVGDTTGFASDTTTYPVLVANLLTGSQATSVDAGLSYNASTNTLTATAFSGTASVASTVTLTADNTTAATNYLLFVNAATGNLSPRTDTGFTYNPSSGLLQATTFGGAHYGSLGSTNPNTVIGTSIRASGTTATGGLGLSGTGTGGVVTQLTGRTTGVTLSTWTGQITLFTTTLAAVTSTAFVLTNTLIAATDLVIVQHVSGGTLGLYNVTATAAAGSATITIRNNSASISASEAPVIKFMVIKATTA